MLVRGCNGSYEFIDFRETAPAAAFQDMYKGNVNASLYGGLARYSSLFANSHTLHGFPCMGASSFCRLRTQQAFVQIYLDSCLKNWELIFAALAVFLASCEVQNISTEIMANFPGQRLWLQQSNSHATVSQSRTIP